MSDAYASQIGAVFASFGILFLLSSIRTFTSSLYLSLFGRVANETVGLIALVVFASSVLAAPLGARSGARRAIALAGTLLAGGTLLSAAWRWNVAEAVLSGTAVVGGTWWLALVQSARPRAGVSPLVAGLPIALAADLGLRALGRTAPLVDQTTVVSAVVVTAGALALLASGIAAYSGEIEWTSPGRRGAAALVALPVLLLVGEIAALDPMQAAVAGGLAMGPEPAGSWYIVAAALGVGLVTGAVVLVRGAPSRRLFGALAIAAGSLMVLAHLPVLSTVGAMVLAAGVLVAAATLPDTASRAAGGAWGTSASLALGWVVFVALAFAYYAYYTPPAPALAAVAIVVLGLLAALPLPGRRACPVEVAVVGVLAIALPLVALLTPPSVSAGNVRTATFRLMTYNVHQGYDEGNVASLDRIAATIRAEDPDVVVLQEIVRGWLIDDQHDALTVLAERTGLQYLWAPTAGDLWGNAVLSRLPLTDVRRIAFPRETALRHVPRGAVLFKVSGVLVIATHLDHIEEASAVRQRQVRAILDAWNGERPAIVAGDLNAEAGSAELRLLEEAGFRDLAKDDGADQPTFPASAPTRRLDHVFGIGVRAWGTHTVATTASDHRPVVMNISK